MNEEEIFHQALARKPEERPAFVQRACAGNPALRASLEALLRANVGATGFLEQPAVDLGLPLAGERPEVSGLPRTDDELPVSEGPGTVIGPYKLLEQIGEGGFGVVFVAEQVQPIRRRVALKVLKPGMDTRQVVARFEAERQALALMDHRNIAQIHDGGTTRDGRPFFVMELVKGIQITDYCDRCSLTTHERLELLLSVCHAVQHAHQKGVIHRDLKPSNVLVAIQDGKPAVKVIDFGVAKAVNQRLSEHSLATGFHQIVGTPLYMSPEQAELSPLDVDTRADIYALGVLLYELLTGSTPLEKERLNKVGYDELRRLIREEEPPLPSDRLSTLQDRLTAVASQRCTDSRQLLRTVRGELDWIVMKCLEKDRNRRYDTANGLAQDIERYLADEPVQACPPSAWYRFRKFARRKKGALGVAGLVLVFLLLLGAGSGWVIRDRAARHANTAQQVRESLTRARAWLGEDKLTLARQELAEARGHIGNDRDALQNLAEEIDTLDAALARFQQFVDLVEQAHDTETRLTQQLALLETDSGMRSAPAPLSDPARNSANAVPFRLQALSCYQVMKRDDWVAGLEQALGQPAFVQQVRRTVYEELLWLTNDVFVRAQDHRSGGKLTPIEAAGLGLVYLHKAEQAWQPTLALYRFRARCHKALGEKEAAAADQTLVRNTPPAMAIDHYLLGLVAQDARDKDEAVKQLEAALQLEPTHYRSLVALGNCLTNLGERREDHAAAAVAFTGCILRRPEDPSPYQGRSIVYSRLRRYEQALADASRAIELKSDYTDAWNSRGVVFCDGLKEYDKSLADFSRAIELKPDYQIAWHNRGVAHRHLLQYDQALADFSKAIELKPDYAGAWNGRGFVYADLRQRDKALADFSKAIELKPDHAEAWYGRGFVYAGLRQYDKALADYSRAIELKPDVARYRRKRGQLYRSLGQDDNAIADFSKIIELFPDDPAGWTDRARIYTGLRQRDKALADLSKAIELRPTSPQVWNSRGFAHWKWRQYDKAIADYSEAIKLQPNFATAWFNRGVAYRAVAQNDKALADLSKAIELRPDHEFAWHNRGSLYLQLRNYDRAVADLSKVIDLRADSAGAWHTRGDAHRFLHQYEKAIADYSEAIQLNPKSGYFHNALARLLATCPESRSRDTGRAIELAKKAVQLLPNEGNFWNTLGVAQYREGSFKDAVTSLEKSMEIQNGGKSLDWFFLAMAHWQLGDKDQAERWYGQAVRWMEKNAPQDEELRRFAAEAAELMKKGSGGRSQESAKEPN